MSGTFRIALSTRETMWTAKDSGLKALANVPCPCGRGGPQTLEHFCLRCGFSDGMRGEILDVHEEAEKGGGLRTPRLGPGQPDHARRQWLAVGRALRSPGQVVAGSHAERHVVRGMLGCWAPGADNTPKLRRMLAGLLVPLCNGLRHVVRESNDERLRILAKHAQKQSLREALIDTA